MKKTIEIETINQLIRFRKSSQEKISKALDMSRRNLCLRLNDPKAFDRHESEVLQKELDVSPEELESLISGQSIKLLYNDCVKKN